MINQGVPIEQATAAVESAIRFQAQRGYQNDIQIGMAPAEAMAKWVPTLFFGAKNANLGQAASFIRATRPAVPRPMNVGGSLFTPQPGGSVIPTPGFTPKPQAAKVSTLDAQTHASILKEIQGIEKDLDAEPGGKDADENRSKLQYKRGQLQEIERRYSPAVPPPVRSTNGATVTRKTKDGRRAVFDASTRQFIRYAD